MHPLSEAPAGVTSTTDLTSIGVLKDVRWNADIKAYEVTYGGTDARIVLTGGATYAESGKLVAADGSTLNTVQALTGYEYTRVGYAGFSDGGFAFGVATPAGAVPAVGSASYDAELTGHAGNWQIYGTALFQFDFGAGTLSGYMDPQTNGAFGSPGLPRYTFTQTVFSPGSTTFSGSFDSAGPTPSSFEGRFTGPHAEELMASFTAPFLDWDANGNPTVWGVMDGVMAGRRP
jgi:hypothetical protein